MLMQNSFDPGNQGRPTPPSNFSNILLCVLAGALGISVIVFALIYTSGRRKQPAPSRAVQTSEQSRPDPGADIKRTQASETTAADNIQASETTAADNIIEETEAAESAFHKPESGTLDIYEEMDGLVFEFASGAGAWNTSLEVFPDGSFSGQFHDSDMGDNSEAYRNGTVYECAFTGKFSPAARLDATSYSARVTELNYETTINGSDRYIEDNTLHVLTEPYGLSLGDDIIFYTPGKKISEIPEGFLSWLQWSLPENARELDNIVICDVNGDNAFFPVTLDPGPSFVPAETAAPVISSGGFIIPDSNSRFLTDSDLDPLTKEELRIARNEIYARCGRRFNDPGLQAYFDSQPWYHGTIMPDDFKESLFNIYEKKNSEFIAAYEKRKGYD